VLFASQGIFASLATSFSANVISLLLHATLANATYAPQGKFGFTADDYEKIGMSSFTQLAELRHRGAFSTVSQTFATCCQRCGQSNDPAISALPQRWYQVREQVQRGNSETNKSYIGSEEDYIRGSFSTDEALGRSTSLGHRNPSFEARRATLPTSHG
jgi:hypothetical protein